MPDAPAPSRAAVLLSALLLLHAWLSSTAAPRLRQPVAASIAAASPPRQLLPPRSVEELVTLTEGGWAPCATGNTSQVRVAWPPGAGAPLPGGARRLALGTRHVLLVSALTATGARVRCGGDYLEAQLQGEHLRHRPRTEDHLDGTYKITLDLPDDPLLAGPAWLNLTLLFVHFAGMTEPSPALWRALAPHSTVFSAALELVASAGAAPLRLPSCRDMPFMAEPFWSGHWVRLPSASSPCPAGLCQGSPARLAQPWVYRLPQCSFELFSLAAARQCVSGSWVLAAGDSCNPYSADSLLADVLGVHNHSSVPAPLSDRTFDLQLTAWEDGRGSAPLPAPPPWLLRLTHIWLGGWDRTGNGAGLSLALDRDALMTLFSHFLSWPGGGVLPDLFFLNSGLHDGFTDFQEELRVTECHHPPPCPTYLTGRAHLGATARFAAAVSAAAAFFRQLAALPADLAAGARLEAGGAPPGAALPPLPPPPRQPRFLWRHTVATAGPRRATIYHNTQKMEVFAHIVARRLLDEGQREDAQPWLFLDEFDMSFPWHYDLDASDHTHYGLKDGRPLAGVVDGMMLHVALNGLCGPSTSTA
jgi:hypothetical protein